jgi:hypothetical protein
MCKYNDDNLIKYEDAIVLHFDQTGEMAWLTMKNYGLVFWEWIWAENPKRWDEVKEITIGVPAGMLNPAERVTFLRKIKNTMTDGEVSQLRPYPFSISLSGFLDVFQIIGFQVHFLRSEVYSHGGIDWDNKEPTFDKCGMPLRTEELVNKVDRYLKSVGFQLGPFLQKHSFYDSIFFHLSRTFSGPPGAPWIFDQICETRKNDFTAYFPHPKFIIQEERTEFTIEGFEGTGKTMNQDSRDIKPIYWPATGPIRYMAPRPPRHFAADVYLQMLDEERKNDPQGFLAGKDRRHLDQANYKGSKKYLHEHIERITCYGFRGDTRSLAEIKAASGFTPGCTRTDAGVARFAEQAAALDLALSRGFEFYLAEVKKQNLLTLGVYTADPDFKAFISASTSVVIAKHFANARARAPDLWKPTFCYAVRCENGFYLPTDATFDPGTDEFWNVQNNSQNALVHNAEQEVAVTLAIPWRHVVGTRRIQPTPKGQVFHGPVFLCDTLRQQSYDRLPKKHAHGRDVTYAKPDPGAFDELFELFSGKSQGLGPWIRLCYPEPPFVCPQELIKNRDKKIAEYEKRKRREREKLGEKEETKASSVPNP